jgi:hypothetical protein
MGTRGFREQRVKILQAGALYFVVVFGIGFVLGTLRVLVVVPTFGARIAELMEAPVMLAVTFVGARWVVRRRNLPALGSVRLGMGGIALGLLLAAEFILALGVRGQSIREYFATLDPVTVTVFYVLLGVFAVMPLFVVRR